MDKCTLGMIKFLKYHIPGYNSCREAAIAYMMEYSGCPRETYTKNLIEQIIFEVFCDFINSVDVPSSQLRIIKDQAEVCKYLNKEFDLYEGMLTAMYLVQVLETTEDGQRYVNGFDEKYI